MAYIQNSMNDSERTHQSLNHQQQLDSYDSDLFLGDQDFNNYQNSSENDRQTYHQNFGSQQHQQSQQQSPQQQQHHQQQHHHQHQHQHPQQPHQHQHQQQRPPQSQPQSYQQRPQSYQENYYQSNIPRNDVNHHKQALFRQMQGPSSVPANEGPSTYTYGPVSVPASSSNSIDYFNYSSSAPTSDFDNYNSNPYDNYNSLPKNKRKLSVQNPANNNMKHHHAPQSQPKSYLANAYNANYGEQGLYRMQESASESTASGVSSGEYNYYDEHQSPQVKVKGKKPAFHLPLDNLKTHQLMFQQMQNLPSSAYSDGSFDQKYSNLEILEPDLGFSYEDGESNLLGFNENITPLMKPPGSNQDDYFDFGPTDPVEQRNSTHLGKYVDANIDSSPQHLKRSESVNDSDNNPNTGSSGNNYEDFENYKFEDDNEGLQYYNYNANDELQPTVSNEKFHPDLSGFNFDVNPKSNKSSFSKMISDHAQQYSSLFPQPAQDKDSAHNRLEVVRPSIERTNSNQSVTSLSSVGSGSGGTNKDKLSSKKKRYIKGAVCTICDKYISRDLKRHMRIHNEVGRFQCVFPKNMCKHKTGYFNRPYDYKKHLLHLHFNFDDPKGKTANTLTDKLPLLGSCTACGIRMMASEWLDEHVLTKNDEKRCDYVEVKGPMPDASAGMLLRYDEM